ncbi:uncharacterized protein LOC135171035 [Diachasmimorpha longicaudata]|uniref:uncharacterized protein LOC135171035 n=1 Tax=Diachasmimorpha longicaudata TaxID=58733 RepID=UPI0030B8835D
MERLREELAVSPKLDLTVSEVEKWSSNIHAGYLFEKNGVSVLQKLCLLVSSIPARTTFPGWQHFGAHLGLSREQLQCIEYDFKGLQDPTYYVLLTFVQCVDATMDKIFDALRKMDRLDIIHRLSNLLTLFVNCLRLSSQSDELHRPLHIPRVPLVLSPVIPLSVLNVMRLSSRIHTGYLFEPDGIPILKILCHLISSTPAGRTYSGWQDFGIHLHLTEAQLHYIKHHLRDHQSPAYYVLLIFVHSTDETMDKVLDALHKMNRLDVVDKLAETLTLFIKSLSLNSQSTNILRPKSVSNIPEILRPIITSKKLSSTSGTQLLHLEGNDILMNYSSSLIREKQNYGSIVMLTFAEDGQNIMKSICQIFREKNPRIGVLILQEQEKLVNSRAEEFIDDCFKQVNYIIPILTKEYTDHINNLRNYGGKLGENSLDSKYLHYIYSLLRFEYVKNNCSNHRVRCLVPDFYVTTMMKSDLHPVLQAWYRQSDIDEFATNILLKKLVSRFSKIPHGVEIHRWRLRIYVYCCHSSCERIREVRRASQGRKQHCRLRHGPTALPDPQHYPLMYSEGNESSIKCQIMAENVTKLSFRETDLCILINKL